MPHDEAASNKDQQTTEQLSSRDAKVFLLLNFFAASQANFQKSREY